MVHPTSPVAAALMALQLLRHQKLLREGRLQLRPLASRQLQRQHLSPQAARVLMELKQRFWHPAVSIQRELARLLILFMQAVVTSGPRQLRCPITHKQPLLWVAVWRSWLRLRLRVVCGAGHCIRNQQAVLPRGGVLRAARSPVACGQQGPDFPARRQRGVLFSSDTRRSPFRP